MELYLHSRKIELIYSSLIDIFPSHLIECVIIEYLRVLTLRSGIVINTKLSYNSSVVCKNNKIYILYNGLRSKILKIIDSNNGQIIRKINVRDKNYEGYLTKSSDRHYKGFLMKSNDEIFIFQVRNSSSFYDRDHCDYSITDIDEKEYYDSKIFYKAYGFHSDQHLITKKNRFASCLNKYLCCLRNCINTPAYDLIQMPFPEFQGGVVYNYGTYVCAIHANSIYKYRCRYIHQSYGGTHFLKSVTPLITTITDENKFVTMLKIRSFLILVTTNNIVFFDVKSMKQINEIKCNTTIYTACNNSNYLFVLREINSFEMIDEDTKSNNLSTLDVYDFQFRKKIKPHDPLTTENEISFVSSIEGTKTCLADKVEVENQSVSSIEEEKVCLVNTIEQPSLIDSIKIKHTSEDKSTNYLIAACDIYLTIICGDALVNVIELESGLDKI